MRCNRDAHPITTHLVLKRVIVDRIQTDQMVIIDEDLVTGITLVLHAVRQAAGGPQ